MRRFIIFSVLLFIDTAVWAQDNYEIQVYGSDLTGLHTTMVELHSNYTMDGSKVVNNNVLPSHHIVHETVEITHGFTNWLEVGFYFFNAIGSEGRTNYVGSHIRPRVAAPGSWHWPFGASLSIEGGYQKLVYSEDDWSVEIRPIIDKALGKWYLSFNPTLDKSLHGWNSDKGYIFSPNAKASFDVSTAWALGVEYYGSVGQITHFSSFYKQEHQLFAAADVNFSPDWELNFGYGRTLTNVGDNSIVKMIIGYRIK